MLTPKRKTRNVHQIVKDLRAAGTPLSLEAAQKLLWLRGQLTKWERQALPPRGTDYIGEGDPDL